MVLAKPSLLVSLPCQPLMLRKRTPVGLGKERRRLAQMRGSGQK